jgi:IS4 transposase
MEVPEEVAVRVIRSRIERPGFRTQEVLIATSLLDPQKYPASEITEAYLRRWRIELSFRDIKTSMEMEHLRAQSKRHPGHHYRGMR